MGWGEVHGVNPEQRRLQRGLEDALEGMKEMYPYVPEYFQEKWELKAYIERAERTLKECRGG